MRKVVVHLVPRDPEDAQRQELLLELLSTGLQRWLSGEPAPDSSSPMVDYSESLSPTTNTNGGDPTGAALS
ncbi:MAG TPA: hypothetical protein VFA32_00050 [Dehalococcoidia bacterium]|jgi:hypothetical protein|nr:hypothetical protein [Dehalococcoidia bacterium]